MKKGKEMIIEAIKNTDMLPPKQRDALEVICESEHPLYARDIENKLNSTTPQIDEKRFYYQRKRREVYI